ncbi:Rossmann-fold NAD(P)-binding domain-containing protein [Parachitinimonas caeni]|uniref:NAD(P)-binding domain-containing protein n=1 Tax=Parachitinimonas caeni TaxID=3031301 RepID=A0ABT7DVH3_9NEIS|nr:NAD(P)H-binding protein [Parachitinimonas caeni]MDK2122637.1 hypothetical protein [Parachitinimonas caeni]
MPDSYRVLMVGASGAVGAATLACLLASPRCSRVVALVRRPLDASVPRLRKLDQRMCDFDSLHELDPADLECEVAICTLGAGQPSKLSQAMLWKTDVYYPAAFARLAKHAGARHISLLSAVNAHAKGRLLYSRIKAEAEAAIQTPGFDRVSLFRPALLLTEAVRYGMPDRINQWLFPKVAGVLPDRFRPIPVETLGRAMAVNVERAGSGLELLYHADFLALGAGDTTSGGRR